MDEVTLDGKVFISSKRAAQITGYAKDYVGQLCREGRVEARLVGRSWYIYEQSIREHRFGQEAGSTIENGELSVSEPENEEIEADHQERSNDEARDKDEDEQRESVDREEVSEIQKAWQEWFEKKNKERENRYEQPIHTQISSVGEEPSEITNKYNDLEIDEDVPEEVHVKKIQQNAQGQDQTTHAVDIVRLAEDTNEEKREEKTTRQSDISFDLTSVPQEAVIRSERIIRPHKARSYRIYKAVLGSCVFILVSITLIATGLVQPPSGPAFSFVEYIAGVTTSR